MATTLAKKTTEKVRKNHNPMVAIFDLIFYVDMHAAQALYTIFVI